jgi:cation diffusion facilitator CzcD-associated flavoprotein CzcO
VKLSSCLGLIVVEFLEKPNSPPLGHRDPFRNEILHSWNYEDIMYKSQSGVFYFFVFNFVLI